MQRAQVCETKGHLVLVRRDGHPCCLGWCLKDLLPWGEFEDSNALGRYSRTPGTKGIFSPGLRPGTLLVDGTGPRGTQAALKRRETTAVRALVAVDNEKTGHFVAQLLREDGHVVEECWTGADALRLIHLGGYGILVVDAALSKIDGFAVSRDTRRSASAPPSSCSAPRRA